MNHLKLTIPEMNRLTPEAFHNANKRPVIVVMDNIRSQHNIGAVFRTADAFLLQGVYLCGICCCPPNQEIHKTALGAEETVDWRYFEHTEDAIAELKQMGYEVYAVEQTHNSITLEDFVASLRTRMATPPSVGTDRKIAVVMGHEVFGVQQSVIDACDGCIEIPQYGTKHSLNVSVTAGIVLYALSTNI